jgi:ribosomal protein L37AE/L43A
MTMNDNSTAVCSDCGDTYSKERWRLGYYTCHPCGEEHAVNVRAGWCIAQLYSKGNYQLVTDLSDLTRTNPKRTT